MLGNGFVRILSILLCLMLLCLSPVSVSARLHPQAQIVLVKKSARKMYLVRNGKALKIYTISLGKNPVGAKTRSGDNRTPEGSYTLDWRKKSSRFYRSIHISYPNREDRSLAMERGEDPGGMIMIHGTPDPYNRIGQELKKRDWTDGCIAVTNDEMREIWNIVPNGTPIYISP